MGASSSAPTTPTLDMLDPDEQRQIMKNLQMLNQRNTEYPGKFTFVDFRQVHAAMPDELAAAVWRGLAGAKSSSDALGLDAVVKAVVPLRTGDAATASAAAAAHLKLCFPGEHAGKAAAVVLEQAAPWLAVVGRPTSSASGAVAQLFAEAACAAWLVDLRELEPLPVLSEGATRLLSTADVRFLARALPAEQRRKWRLLFTTARDGVSFSRFVSMTTHRAPCLVVLRDKQGAVFGGFASEPLTVSPKFGNGYGSFLFTLDAPPRFPRTPAIHRASGDNANLVYLNIKMEQICNGLAFGGNLEASFFGLWVRDDLESGRSDGPCATYSQSPCLASSTEFAIDEIEVWAVEDDPPPPTEDEAAAAAGENALTAAGVLSSKHQETRAFLAMAGRTQHAANLGIEKDDEAVGVA